MQSECQSQLIPEVPLHSNTKISGKIHENVMEFFFSKSEYSRFSASPIITSVLYIRAHVYIHLYFDATHVCV